MPLILFCGFPSSGKSVWAEKIAEFLRDRISQLQAGEEGSNLKVTLHSDHSLGIKHEMYRESNTEKAARAAQLTAVKRDISKNNIVILDTMSYNKGFRYQLHCEVKSAYTTHCVVQIICPTSECFQLNGQREGEDKWDDDLLRQMIARYEEPDGSKRWDSPLISIAHDDSTQAAENPVFEEIWQTLVKRKVSKPNQATILKPAVGANYLQELDRLTNQVVSDIVAHQQLDSFGTLPIRNTVDGTECTVELPAGRVSTAQLQRIKRSFVGLNRVRQVDAGRIIPLFAAYVSQSLAANDAAVL